MNSADLEKVLIGVVNAHRLWPAEPADCDPDEFSRAIRKLADLADAQSVKPGVFITQSESWSGKDTLNTWVVTFLVPPSAVDE